MADHEDATDYTANGPTEIGFRTDGTRIENGVVAFGKQIGVQGISVGGDTGSFFCGVFGDSHDGIGVQGHSASQAGVIGISDGFHGVAGEGGKQGNGVSGTSESNDGIVGRSSGEGKSGVFGFHTKSNGAVFGVSGSSESRDGAGVNGFSDHGAVGVRGFSAENDAVVGTSSGENKSGVFGFHLQSDLPGFGVTGRTESAKGTGVAGFSKNGGIGVRGSSDTGTGGVFSSDNSAQVNLVPKLDKLPRDGKAGDLLVINGPIDPEDPGLTGAILHVCLRSSDSQDPAMWGKVVFKIA
jgi:hypothetical protein